MKLNKISVLLALFCAFGVACSHQAKVPDDTTAGFAVDNERDPAQAKTFDQVLQETATGALKFNEAHLLIDNDEAFSSKINAIRSAKSGETVRMVYYIFSNDESSSVFVKEIIAQAKKGVKFQILVDLITNYAKLDLFKWMEQNGNGNIKVRLYGRPSEIVIKDAMYMTRPCPAPSKAVPPAKECQIFKWGQINRELDALQAGGTQCTKKAKLADASLRTKCEAKEREYKDFYASLMLAGLYGKSGAATQVAFNYGSDIAATADQKAAMTADQKAKLKKLVKLVIDAKVFGETSAYLKLGLAMMFYANDVNPALNQIYGRFPFDTPDPDTPAAQQETAMEHWQHITDYTHHKLLLVGDDSSARFMQLGGRNIENSYHMKFNKEFSKKYTFADTDFAANLTSGGESMVTSFRNMWDYSDVVVDIYTAGEFLNSDMGFNGGAVLVAANTCEAMKKNTDRETMAKCLVDNYKNHSTDIPASIHPVTKKKIPALPRYKNESERIAEAGATIEANAAKYLSKYTVASAGQSFRSRGYSSMSNADSSLSNSDLGADIYYVENLPWMRDKSGKMNPSIKERTLNFNNGQERLNNKNIHHLWLTSMRNACNSKATEQTEIILHSAYWFPAVNMLDLFRSMIDGTLPCSNVTVKIITNSFQTTDLNILNVFARYQMKSFYMIYDYFKKAEKDKKFKKAATFEYYEYKPFVGTTADQLVSLHTKLSLIGNDIIIGSANADIRSFMMDTNNAVYIRNAPSLAQDYRRWIASILPANGQQSEWVNEASNQFRLPLGPDMDLSDPNKPKGNFECRPEILATYATPNPRSTGNLRDDDMCFMAALAMKWPSLKKNAENWQTMKEIQKATATDIFTDILAIMSTNAELKVSGPERQKMESKLKSAKENKTSVGNEFNRKYQVF